MSLPAAEISAPESGRTLMLLEPLEEDTWTVISSAGSVEATLEMLDIVGYVILSALTDVDEVESECLVGLPWNTLA